MSQTQKSTVNSNPGKIELFRTLMKTSDSKYLAVLSDDSMDRDGEIVSREALLKIAGNESGKTAILLDHENKIENMVGEWTNQRIENIDGHTALIAEPKFYESNPKAQMIKGMLDEGAHCGISIGAMVKGCEERKIEEKSVNVYTELELLEASFVAIPSNRHGMAMALAKKFSKKLNEETQKMAEEKTYSEKEFNEILDQNEALKAEVAQLQKDAEEAPAEPEAVAEEAPAVEEKPAEEESEAPAEEEAEKSGESELAKQVADLQKQNALMVEQMEKLQGSPVLKAQHDSPEGNQLEANNEVNKGKLPILIR